MGIIDFFSFGPHIKLMLSDYTFGGLIFTLWYILGWQFPVWLWVLSGLFYIKALKLKKGKTKKKN